MTLEVLGLRRYLVLVPDGSIGVQPMTEFPLLDGMNTVRDSL